MKRVYPSPEWPESWKTSYEYDLLEIYGGKSSLSYACAYQKRFNTTLGLIESVLPAGSSAIDIAAAQGNFLSLPCRTWLQSSLERFEG